MTMTTEKLMTTTMAVAVVPPDSEVAPVPVVHVVFPEEVAATN